MNAKNEVRPRIGDIYLIEFSGIGSEQKGVRPGLVIQNNVGNLHSPNVISLPLTTKNIDRPLPTHVFISSKDSGLLRDSVVLCENPERISKERIIKYITSLSDEYMERIASAFLISSSVVSYLNQEKLIELWERAVVLNK